MTQENNTSNRPAISHSVKGDSGSTTLHAFWPKTSEKGVDYLSGYFTIDGQKVDAALFYKTGQYGNFLSVTGDKGNLKGAGSAWNKEDKNGECKYDSLSFSLEHNGKKIDRIFVRDWSLNEEQRNKAGFAGEKAVSQARRSAPSPH